ncbi:hypothetical protein MMC22_003990 [Lobaria immixta]|nr:hypothetical protein [Lobaria immixta]
MDPSTFVDPQLTRSDLLVLGNLLRHVDRVKDSSSVSPAAKDVIILTSEDSRQDRKHLPGAAIESDAPHATLTRHDDSQDDQKVIDRLNAWNDPKSDHFDPTVFVAWDLPLVNLPVVLDRGVIQPYIRWARTVVRTETDVVMLTHLIMYFTTSVPSVLYLYYRFSWCHGVLHWLMQSYYVGTYTLMMHQHIHMNGILSRKYAWFDRAFPYIMDPLMGHTWNSYYHHHVKHHHIEANGPDDLSSTIRYQRDDLLHFLHYVGRFFFFVWLDLPVYFVGKGKTVLALKTLGSELISYFILYVLATRVNFHATLFAFLLPLMLVRLVLMVGNWGQHALVDEVEPDSDFRSSITLIDVAVIAFIKQKDTYARESALVFRNIDYIMMTVKLLQKDYRYLAKCLVPMGDQIGMDLDEISTMLRTKTRRFTEEEIRAKFHSKQQQPPVLLQQNVQDAK